MGARTPLREVMRPDTARHPVNNYTLRRRPQHRKNLARLTGLKSFCAADGWPGPAHDLAVRKARAIYTLHPTTLQTPQPSAPGGKKSYRVCDYFYLQTLESPDRTRYRILAYRSSNSLSYLLASAMPTGLNMQVIEFMESSQWRMGGHKIAGVRFRHTVFATGQCLVGAILC